MEKIPTIFERNWDTGKLTEKTIVGIPSEAIATEKLDGTNVRVTIRSCECVRLEKRKNPSKNQKARGIKDPWYIDAIPNDPADQYIWDALNNSILKEELKEVPDGAWSAEAIGPKIQTNPLELEERRIVIFEQSLDLLRIDVPDFGHNKGIPYNKIKGLLPTLKSYLNSDKGIEGIVWWYMGEPIGKIKIKEFSYDSAP